MNARKGLHSRTAAEIAAGQQDKRHLKNYNYRR